MLLVHTRSFVHDYTGMAEPQLSSGMQAAAAASSAAQAAAAAAQANSAIIANATELFTTKLDPTSFKVMKVMHTDTSPSAGGTTSRSVYKTFGIGLAHIADKFFYMGLT